MKKLLITIVVILMACGCSPNEGNQEPKQYNTELAGIGRVSGTSVYIRKFELEGHEYFLFSHSGGYGTNISVIHSESCPCKNNHIY